MKSLLTIAALMIFALSTVVLSGCHTVEGAGRDVEAVGEGVQEGARDVRGYD